MEPFQRRSRDYATVLKIIRELYKLYNTYVEYTILVYDAQYFMGTDFWLCPAGLMIFEPIKYCIWHTQVLYILILMFDLF